MERANHTFTRSLPSRRSFLWKSLSGIGLCGLSSRLVAAPAPGAALARSAGEWEARRNELRHFILRQSGLRDLRRGPAPRLEVRRGVRKPHFDVYTFRIETFPGFYAHGNLYQPVRGVGPFPLVLAPNGHWDEGRLTDRKDYSMPTLCANLAARGMLVCTWDMLGYNETRQIPHKLPASLREKSGITALGIQLWNTIRITDAIYLQRFARPGFAGITGTSGGATQALLAAAVDDRFRAVAPVCMVSSHFDDFCSCEKVPALWDATSLVEVAAMAAPRPQLIVSASGDWTRNTPEVEFPAVQEIYQLYRAEAEVENFHQRAGHNCNAVSRSALYEFFTETFGLERRLPHDLEIAHHLRRDEIATRDAKPSSTLTRQYAAWWASRRDSARRSA